MKDKAMKKTVLACVAAALIVTLVIALSIFFLTKPVEDAQAAEMIMHATYMSTHGQLTDVEGGHRTDADAEANLKNNYGASGNILKITNGAQLFRFLNNQGDENGFTHAYLAANVGINYSNGSGGANSADYDFSVSQASSGSVFSKVLDGNGYTVSVWGASGSSGSGGFLTYYQESDNYNSYGSATYRYSGLLVGVNKGTIANLTVEYKSNHVAITARTGDYYNWGWKSTGQFVIGEMGCLHSADNGNYATVAGIVAGANGFGGVIDNVRVNVNNNFTVIDWAASSGYMINNVSLVGGIVGRAIKNSVVRNSQVHIADDNAGIYAGAEGWTSAGPTDDASALAVCGGLVGKIDKGASENGTVYNAVVEYCAITGGGIIKAFVNRAKGKDQYYRCYVGGAIGACLNITGGTGDIQDGGKSSGTNHPVNAGQVKGIISDWSGTAQNNYENKEAVVEGQLFGSVGDQITSVTVLYDLLTLRQNNGRDLSIYPNLDSNWSNANSDWVGVFPTTEGGGVTVRLAPTGYYFVRVHAFADNTDHNDESLKAVDLGSAGSKRFTRAEGETGNIIWKAILETKVKERVGDNDVWTGEIETTERISLRTANPTYAEINMIGINAKGDYKYSFGDITTLSFVNTNGDTTSREYRGKTATLNLPSVKAASGVDVSFNSNEWIVLRNGVATSSDMSGTALPGTYTVNVKSAQETFATMGYYSDAQRTAAWQPTSPYKYVITEGVLTYGANTKVAPDWSKEAKFELTMSGGSNDFDSVKFVRNGTVVADSDKLFNYSGISATVTIKDSTGKNGTKYSFIAYAKDGNKDIVVARTSPTQDYNVKIDVEAPEISDLAYYAVDSAGNESRLYASDLAIWRKEKVVAKYTVTDSKSGIKFAESTSGISNTALADGTGYNVEVTLTNSTEKPIKYTDMMGNTQEVILQANCDYMSKSPKLAFYSQTYPTGNNGYSKSGVIIRFKPTVGSSPWQLQYSWKKDGDGADIWQDAYLQNNGIDTADTYEIGDNALKSYTVNWNMGDPIARRGEDFKLRIVNVYDLYDPVYLSKDGVVTDDGFVGNYIVNYKIASLYVDTALSAVKVYGGSYGSSGESLAAILARADAAELASLFNRAYDATDAYTNKYTFKVSVQYTSSDHTDPDGYAYSNGVGVLYSPAYIAKPQNINVEVDLTLKYADPNVGEAVGLYAYFDVSASVEEKYDIYFAGHEYFVNKDDKDEDKKFSNSFLQIDGFDDCYVTDGKIAKLIKTISLDGYVKDRYYYGDTLPERIDGVAVEGLDGYVSVEIRSALTGVCDAREQAYTVEGNVNDIYGNIEVAVTPKDVYVDAKPVYIDIKMDGNDDIMSTVSAGVNHAFTATYEDIYGADAAAGVKYFKLSDNGVDYEELSAEATADGVIAKGSYKIVASTENANYVSAFKGFVDAGDVNYVPGTYQFFFAITQGRLALSMGINVREYTGGDIAYDPGIPNVSSEIFSESQLSYTYFRYHSTAEYENGVIINPNYDRNAPMTSMPVELGCYRVEVNLEGNESFFSETYVGDLVIVIATTTFAANSLSYAYTGDAYTYDLEQALASVIASNGATPWDYSLDRSKVAVQYFDMTSSQYKPVSEEIGGDGWFSELGVYTYRIDYEGDEHYGKCSATVKLTITEAEFVGVWFIGAEGVYNGKNYVDEISLNQPYADAKATFTYGGRRYASLSDITITEAGTYEIKMTLSMSGYRTTTYDPAVIVISKAAFSGISAVPAAATYDGNQHAVTFNGITAQNGSYYYTVKDANGIPVKGEDGKDIQVKCTVAGLNNQAQGNLYAVNAGDYIGTVTISAPNFETLTLNTVINIAKAEMAVTDAWTDLPSKVPSGVSVSQYYGACTSDGKDYKCKLIFTDRDSKEVVAPNSDGVLPDGRYTVTLDVGENNFVSREWKLAVGKINSKELSTGAWIAVGAAVVVMAAAVVTSVVVVNKRKKKDLAEAQTTA